LSGTENKNEAEGPDDWANEKCLSGKTSQKVQQDALRHADGNPG